MQTITHSDNIAQVNGLVQDCSNSIALAIKYYST